MESVLTQVKLGYLVFFEYFIKKLKTLLTELEGVEL